MTRTHIFFLFILIASVLILSNLYFGNSKTNNYFAKEELLVSDDVLPVKTLNNSVPSCNVVNFFIQEATKIDAHIDKLSMWASQKNLMLNTSNINKEIRIQLLGVDVEKYRKFSTYTDETQESDDPLKPLEKNLALKLYQHVLLQEYDLIISMVDNDVINSSMGFSEKSILSFIMNTNPKIEPSALSLIVNSGLSPTINDLATATRLNLSVEAIEILRANFYGDLGTTWRRGYRQESLAMIAVEKLNYNLFKYWRSEGSPTAPENDINSLDIIELPSDNNKRSITIKIFDILANDKIYPYKITTLERVENWLTPKELETHKTYLRDAKKYMEQRNVAHIKDFDALDSNTLLFIQDLKGERKRINAIIDSCRVPKNDRFTELGNENKEENKWTAFNSLSKYEKSLIVGAQSALIAKDWDRYLMLHNEAFSAEEVGVSNTIAISQLIHSNAPFEYIEVYINIGTPLLVEHLALVMVNDNLELMESILPYSSHIFESNVDNIPKKFFDGDIKLSKEMELLLEKNTTWNIDYGNKND